MRWLAIGPAGGGGALMRECHEGSMVPVLQFLANLLARVDLLRTRLA